MTDARDKATCNHQNRNAFLTYRGITRFDTAYI